MKNKNHVSTAAILLVSFTLLFSAVPALALSNIYVRQSNDLVNSQGYLSLSFIIGVSHFLTGFSIELPANYTTTNNDLEILSPIGVPSGHVSLSCSGSPTTYCTVAYTFASKQFVPIGRVIELTLAGIQAPSIHRSSTYESETVSITTYNGAVAIEGPTASTAFDLRQITGADIATSSVLEISSLTVSGATTIGGIIYADANPGISTNNGQNLRISSATGTVQVVGALAVSGASTLTGLLTANGGLIIGSGSLVTSISVTSPASTVTLTTTSSNVQVLNPTADIGLILPTPVGNAGLEFTIVLPSSSGHTVSVDTPAGDIIGLGASSTNLVLFCVPPGLNSVTVVSDGSNWLVIAYMGN